MGWKISSAIIVIVWLCIAEVFLKTALPAGYWVSYAVIVFLTVVIFAKHTISRMGDIWVSVWIPDDMVKLPAQFPFVTDNLIDYRYGTVLFSVKTRESFRKIRYPTDRLVHIRVPVSGIGVYRSDELEAEVLAIDRWRISAAIANRRFIILKSNQAPNKSLYKRIWIELALFCPLGYSIF